MLYRQEVIKRQNDRLHGTVMLTQPRSTTAISVLLSVACVGVLVFASVGTYARTETVRGILTTDKPIVRVLSPKAGVLISVFKQDGESVKKGDVLAIVDMDTQEEGGGVAKQGLGLLSEQVALIGSQESSAKALVESNSQRLEQRAAEIDRQLTGFSEQIDLQRQLVASNELMIERLAPVVARGFVTGMELERRRQAALQSAQQLAVLRQQASNLRAERSQLAIEKAALRPQLEKELAGIRSTLSDVRRERLATSGARSLAIRSPIDGKVTAIQLSEGQMAQPGIALLTIIPNDANIVADLYAPTQAVGFIEVDQAVQLLVDAFPYQKFGTIAGRVKSVSATMIDPRESYAPFKIEEPVFKMRAVINPGIGPMKLRLQPGMTLNATITIERRTFVEWLLSPLMAVVKRNG